MSTTILSTMITNPTTITIANIHELEKYRTITQQLRNGAQLFLRGKNISN